MQIGPVKVGSDHPVALQTMTTTDTRDVQATIDQVCHPVLHGLPAIRLASVRLGSFATSTHSHHSQTVQDTVVQLRHCIFQLLL